MNWLCICPECHQGFDARDGKEFSTVIDAHEAACEGPPDEHPWMGHLTRDRTP